MSYPTPLSEPPASLETIRREQIIQIASDFASLTLAIAETNNAHYGNNYIPYDLDSVSIFVPQRADFHAYDVVTHSRHVGAMMEEFLGVKLVNIAESDPHTSIQFSADNRDLDLLITGDFSASSELSQEFILRRGLYRRGVLLGKSIPTDQKPLLALSAFFHDMGKLLEPRINKLEGAKLSKVDNKFSSAQKAYGNDEDFEKKELSDRLTITYYERLLGQNLITKSQFEFLANIHLTYMKLTAMIKDRGVLPEDIAISHYFSAALLLVNADELGKGVIFFDNSSEAISNRVSKLSRLENIFAK
jgi:hypothetical protein